MDPSAGVTAVAFDLGGVVCRFDPHVRWQRLSAASGLAPETIDARLHDSGYMDACDTGALSADESHRELERQLGWRCEREELEAIWCSAFTPEADVLGVLDRLTGHARLAMLTNNGFLLLHAFPRRFPEVAARFDPMVFSCEIGCLKPDPRAYRALLARTGTSAPETAFVDDTQANVDGAEAVGLRGINFHDAARLETELGHLGLLTPT